MLTFRSILLKKLRMKEKKKLIRDPQREQRRGMKISTKKDHYQKSLLNQEPKDQFIREFLRSISRRGKSEQVLPEHSWTSIFQQLKSKLPRVGAKEFRATEPIFQEIQSLCPELRIIQVVACKGVEKFLSG